MEIEKDVKIHQEGDNFYAEVDITSEYSVYDPEEKCFTEVKKRVPMSPLTSLEILEIVEEEQYDLDALYAFVGFWNGVEFVGFLRNN